MPAHRKLALPIICLAALGWLSPGAMAADDLTEREEAAMIAAVQRVAPSVVSIETIGGLERVGEMLVGTGPTTGLVVSSDGYIVSSAFSFAQSPSSILVGFADGTRAPARLVATDRSRMLVLLKTQPPKPLAVPEAAPEKEVQVGKWAIAVGRTFEPSQPNMSVGIVSALDRIGGKAVQTDAKVSPANYGGPLVDIHGRVIGVLVPLSPDKGGESAGVEWYDSGIGFAVPLEHILRVLPRLQKGSDLYPGILGVSLRNTDLYADPPVIVSCRPNSPASKAGLKAGDKLVAIDGEPIERRAQLTRQVQQHYAGDTLRVAVLRGSERLERELELIQKLPPYERAFLGILPARDPVEEPQGVAIRHVYADSPAAKAGLKPGDRITRLDDQAVADRDALIEQLGLLAVGQQVRLEVRRGEETLKLEATLVGEPEGVPAQLPPARQSRPKSTVDLPAVGIVHLKLPQLDRECLAYVPENYDPEVAYGVLIWLHGPDGFDEQKLIKRWRDLCQASDFILLAPKAEDADRWPMRDLALAAGAFSRVRDAYHVDPLRIAAHGYQGGGTAAYRLAFELPEVIRGVAAVDATIPADPPENTGEHRLDFFLVRPKTVAADRRLDKFRQEHYAVTSRQTESARYLDDDELAELLRWFDTLDKL
jgi:serine protease Do